MSFLPALSLLIISIVICLESLNLIASRLLYEFSFFSLN